MTFAFSSQIVSRLFFRLFFTTVSKFDLFFCFWSEKLVFYCLLISFWSINIPFRHSEKGLKNAAIWEKLELSAFMVSIFGFRNLGFKKFSRNCFLYNFHHVAVSDVSVYSTDSRRLYFACISKCLNIEIWIPDIDLKLCQMRQSTFQILTWFGLALFAETQTVLQWSNVTVLLICLRVKACVWSGSTKTQKEADRFFLK